MNEQANFAPVEPPFHWCTECEAINRPEFEHDMSDDRWNDVYDENGSAE